MSETGLVSVIIPAHNEEAVIRRTLITLLCNADSGTFEVIVVCNGCCDHTAEVAAGVRSDITVMQLDEASKTAAINAGLRRARGSVCLLLDADIELDTESALALAQAAFQPQAEAAIGYMDVNTEGADLLVRAFYRVWMEHPYIQNGKFAAVIALSREGIARIGTLPNVTADDTYLRRLFPAERVTVVKSVRFKVRAPRTVEALVRVRSRSYRGNRQLDSLASVPERHSGEARGLLRRLLLKPSLWLAAPVYIAINLAARSLSLRDTGTRWERDLTTRTPQVE